MGRAYSLDLRERVVGTRSGCPATSGSALSVQRFRQTGSVAPDQLRRLQAEKRLGTAS